MKLIDTIEIKNFKSIRHQKIERCKRINVFIGYPNVGKSNILEAIGLFCYLRLTKELFELKDICRVKHFSELFFNQDYKESIGIKINEQLDLKLGLNTFGELGVEIGILEEVNKTAFKNMLFGLQISAGNKLSSYNDVPEPAYNKIAPVVKKYDFKPDIQLNRQTSLSLSVPYGDNLLDVLQGNSTLRKDIIGIFETYKLRLFIDRSDQSIKFFKELNDGTAISVPYHQVADTLRRLIFYKAAIETNTEAALLFEEPEAHMFPPYIRKFTSDVIFDKTNQFFIATHSPYVLDAFLEDAPNDVAIYLVDYVNGESKIHLLSQQDIEEIRDYGVDLFFNIESYLRHGKVNNA